MQFMTQTDHFLACTLLEMFAYCQKSLSKNHLNYDSLQNNQTISVKASRKVLGIVHLSVTE